MKAERDILAEADNEWVVRLYYSFQDRDSLYFVMDYIPGGDMMSLLIRMGVFPEPLARFYVAELTLAIESVHKMGFIHRDIKPDNILIDLDGHIKLTDFGLCTGFRWTHNSKYYQKGVGVCGDASPLLTCTQMEIYRRRCFPFVSRKPRQAGQHGAQRLLGRRLQLSLRRPTDDAGAASQPAAPALPGSLLGGNAQLHRTRGAAAQR